MIIFSSFLFLNRFDKSRADGKHWERPVAAPNLDATGAADAILCTASRVQYSFAYVTYFCVEVDVGLGTIRKRHPKTAAMQYARPRPLTKREKSFMSRIIRAFSYAVGGLLLATAALVSNTVQAAGDKVTIGLVANVNTLDPHKTATADTDLSVISHLYSSLVIRGPDLKLKPNLAKSWRAVDDLTWRFELVPGVTFPNGEKMDAAAVKWNVDRVLDPKLKARIRAWFTPIKEVRVINPTTLELITNKPFAALADQLSMFFLLPPKWSQDHNPAIEAMGTGPYDLVTFKSGDHLELRAKDNYWGAKATFKTAIFRVMPEASSRIAALLAGEVDLIHSFPPSEIARINASGRAEAGAEPSIRFMMLKFNNLIPPFKGNQKLRLAINHAIDSQAIIDSLWDGHGSIARCQPMSGAYFGFNPDLKPIPYDPKKAKALLVEAGYPNGLKVDFEVPTKRYLQGEEIGQIIAAQLGEVGVQAKIIEMDFGQWLTKFRKAGNLGNMAYLGMAWPTLDADGLLTLFEPGNKYAYYENQKFKDLLSKARSTTNKKERLSFYKEASETICADPPHVSMFHQPKTWAQSKSISWQKRGDEWFRAMDIKPR